MTRKMPTLLSIKSFFLDNKTAKQTILKNTFWIACAEIIQRGVGFLIVVMIARHFGPTISGQWAFAINFSTIFIILADFGFSGLIVREIAGDKSKSYDYIGNMLLLKLIFSGISLIAIFTIINFIGKDEEAIRLMSLLGIYVVANSFAVFFQSVFRAYEKMEYEAVCRISQSVFLFFLVFFLIVNKSSVVAIGFAYAVAVFLCLFVSLFFVLRNFSRFSLKINPNVCRKILAVAYPFALSSVAVFAYYRIDTVILGFHRSASELGYYDAAYNIILVAVAPITFFVIATFPFLSRIYKESREKFTKVIDNFFKLIFVLSFPFIAAFFFNAGLIINIIYGQKFLRFSPQFLQVLVWSVLILYNYSIFAVGLSASDNQKTYSMAVICGAVFNIIANLIFIPIYGAIAAAVITVLTEIVVCVYMSYKFLSFQKMRLPWVFIFKILFSFVIMAISIIVFNRLFDVGLLLASFFGVAIYGVAVFAFIGRKNLLAISKF